MGNNSNFNEASTNRKGKAGIPGVKSEFTFKDRLDGDGVPLSEVADAYDLDAIPVNVHDDWLELAVVDHFGHEIHITTDSAEEVDRFQVWGDPIVAEFQREDDVAFTAAWLNENAARVYDEALVARMKRMKGADPVLDEQLDREITMVGYRAKGSKGLTIPDGWDGEYPLTAAADRVGDRLECGENLRNPDSTNARCDWAEVGEEGIAYGYNIPVKFIGEITVGEQREDEKDDEYAARVWDTDKVTSQQLEEFFRTEYNVQVNDAGDYGDFDLEFYIEYGPEGAAGTSIESMGDRVESETKLLAARNEWEYGGGMQSKFATFLGYHSESVFDDANNYVGSRWMKDEE